MLVLDLGLSAVFVVFYGMMQSMVAHTIDTETRIKTEIQKEESLSFMKEDIQAAQIYESKLYNYIVGKDDVVGFIKILENMVLTSNLKSQVDSVVTEGATNLAAVGAEYIHVHMTVTGEWKNIMYFANILEHYPLKIDVRGVALSKFGEYVIKGKKVPQWSAGFDFTVIKLKDM